MRSSWLDANYGATGWAGLGDYCWLCDHLHSRLNLYYSNGDDRGTACQEIGHNIGLDHYAAGDCMALRYFASGTEVVESHSPSDVWSVYRHGVGY